MTIVIKTHLKCNECGEKFGDGIGKKGNQLRILAKRKGWSKSSDKEYCPACREKRKTDKKVNRPAKYAKKYNL